MSGVSSLARAGHWFLHSGIQDPEGGVARFYRADLQKNQPVSTEITGYTASALVFLFHATGDQEYLDRARLTARFLCDRAWDPALRTFPFEHPSPSVVSAHESYFFDCGIIVRGLLSVWRVTGEARLLQIALDASRGMLADFGNRDVDFHPILELPGKHPVPRSGQWSRLPGCYQLKSALAWLEVADATGETDLRAAYHGLLAFSLRTYREFLPGVPEPHRVMDRLHAACYFLEALYPVLDRADCIEAYRSTMTAVARYVQEIASEFVRSDVYAQLLRARVYGSKIVPLDASAASAEATALASFQAVSCDPRAEGGFLFGRRRREMIPHVNPVSTAFAMQALEVWRARESGEENPCLPPPV